MRKRIIEIIVGLFMLAGVIGLMVLAVQVSGLTHLARKETYAVTAGFDNIGNLKARAAVTIAGVKIGQVRWIKLNPVTFKAIVTMDINKRENKIPTDSTARILTKGLLGANYVSLVPGFEEKVLAEGSLIESTQPALILENLISQLLFQLKPKAPKTQPQPTQ